MRIAITLEEKLSLTLRFLASRASHRDLVFSFRISPSIISQIVPEVCSALYKTFKDEYLHGMDSIIFKGRMAKNCP